MAHMPAPKLAHDVERRRLAALHSYGILDSEKESSFEDITRIASMICGTPIAVVNLIDADRQWFKSEVGLGVRETPLATSICAHTILEHDVLLVPDTTRDPRFAENPLVTGDPGLRFYAGALLKTADGLPIGTVCVLDTKARTLAPEQVDVLRGLARQVMSQLELRRMLAASERTNRHFGRLVASAGHDLKSPLRGALYAIDRAKAVSPPDVQARLDGASAQLLHIDQQFTRLSAAATSGVGISPDVTSIPLQPVFDTMASTWTAAAARKGIALTVSPTSVTVVANAALLETLIGNLLSNAVKYSPEGSAVTVSARVDGRAVEVAVTDNGIGMTDDDTRDLFAAFRQADPSADGLGLGLWIVQQTAEALDARVAVESTLGEGTTFRVRLQRGDA